MVSLTSGMWVSWESVGSAYIHGLIGAGNGAVGGAVAGAVVAGGGLIAGAVGVPTAVITGVGATLATVGVGLGVLSAGVNFAQGNIATGVVDLAGSIYGASKLWSGYQNSKLRFYEEPNPPLLNSSGAIVPAGSSALATRTSVGGSLSEATSPNINGALYYPHNAHELLAKLDSLRLELFGGPEGRLGNAINIDIEATRGINSDILQDGLRFIASNSVTEITTFNPYSTFLNHETQ
jgi:hypothetical protein